MPERMSNDLSANLNKRHTTKLGVKRIKKTMGFDTPDAVEWCKQKVISADEIIQNGKNWYVCVDGCVITINAHSYTIITAHIKKKQEQQPKLNWFPVRLIEIEYRNCNKYILRRWN